MRNVVIAAIIVAQLVLIYNGIYQFIPKSVRVGGRVEKQYGNRSYGAIVIILACCILLILAAQLGLIRIPYIEMR